jgi:hypothetical protein
MTEKSSIELELASEDVHEFADEVHQQLSENFVSHCDFVQH